MQTQILLEGRHIQSWATYPDEYPVQPGWVVVESVPTDVENYYYLNNRFVRKPVKPGEHHDFNYETLNWELNLDKFWLLTRMERDKRIASSDWTQLPDVLKSMTLAEQEAWTVYRQALRDITLQDPDNIIWPVAPS